MKIYFLSDLPCELSVNNEPLGRCDGFERFTELSLRTSPFVCFQAENALPISFYLTENIRFAAPDGCEVYLFKDGLAVYARTFAKSERGLKIHVQERFEDTLFTVFCQGEWQTAINAPDAFAIDALPFPFEKPRLSLRGDLVFLESERALAVYTKTGKRVLCERAQSYRADNGTLVLKRPCATDTYSLSAEGVTLLSHEYTPLNAPIAYAFFESVLNGGNYGELLGETLAPKAAQLKAFLGDFHAVAPTDDEHTCALVRKRGNGIFWVELFTVTTENDRITDIKG